jgi:hypothetical protein
VLFRTLETVAVETAAAFATSRIVTLMMESTADLGSVESPCLDWAEYRREENS